MIKKLILFVSLFCSIQLSAQEQTAFSNQDSLIIKCLNEINPDSIKNSIQFLQDFGTRFMLDTNHRTVALSLKQKFENMGYQNTVMDSFYVEVFTGTSYAYSGWQYNVIATLQGSLYPDSVCICGAHYDSACDSVVYGKKAPGADDNASGVAAALEIARIFKKMNYQPNLSIKFIAFGAEELMGNSLSGSEYYATKADSLGEKIKFFINNDMIAYEPSSTNWHADLYCFDSTFWMNNFAAEMCMQYTSITPNLINQVMPGDAYRFYQKGFQSMHFFEDIFNPYYHTANDVVANLNMDYCAEMTKLTMAMLMEGTKVQTGINNDRETNNNIIIYPNPSYDRLNIQFNKNENYKVQILNAKGETIINSVLNSEASEIDISNLNKGIYIISLFGNNSIYHKKFIKK